MNKDFIEILLASLIWFFATIVWMPHYIIARQKNDRIDSIFSTVGFYGSLVVSLGFLLYAFNILLHTS